MVKMLSLICASDSDRASFAPHELGSSSIRRRCWRKSWGWSWASNPLVLLSLTIFSSAPMNLFLACHNFSLLYRILNYDKFRFIDSLSFSLQISSHRTTVGDYGSLFFSRGRNFKENDLSDGFEQETITLPGGPCRIWSRVASKGTEALLHKQDQYLSASHPVHLLSLDSSTSCTSPWM